MTQLTFEGLFNENERSDHVFQCTHPVFANYAFSTYTFDQAERMIDKLPIRCVEVLTSGECSVGDPITQQPITDELTCILAGGTWTGARSAGKASASLITNPIISNNDDLAAGQSPSANHMPCDAYNLTFARFDILKKQYIEVRTAKDWNKRYPEAMNEIHDLSLGSEPLSNPAGNQTTTGFTGYVGDGIIKLNRAANEGKYAFLANDSDAVKRTKLNVQLLLNEIQSSLSGVLNFEANIAFTLHPDCTTFSSGVPFSLHLYDSNVETRSNKRAVVQRGKPRFAMQPNLAFGVAYAGAIPTNQTPGVYAPPEAGGDNNPNNMVGGELDVTYDPNTKMFEAGNKAILARLLTDVNRASLNNVNLELADGLTPEQLSPTGDHYMGNFSTGWALPLQMHNNNPYEYGPVFKNFDCGNLEKHKIRVINRAPKVFPKGQIVMCHKLSGGEWIIQDFGFAEQETKQFEFGRWQFWKSIANKDAYRRDDRFHYDPNLAEYHEAVLNDSTYEGLFRTKFYKDIRKLVGLSLTEYQGTAQTAVARPAFDEINNNMFGEHSLARMNGADKKITDPLGVSTGLYKEQEVNFIGSRRYQQTTAFDQMSIYGGGLQYYELIGLANPYRELDGGTVENVTADDYFHEKLFPHWGPILIDGYTVDSISNLGSTDQGNGLIKGYRTAGMNTSALLEETTHSLKDVKGSPSLRFSDNVLSQADGLGLHLPAEVGLNAAPYSENGSPIEDLNELIRCVNLVSNEGGAFSMLNQTMQTAGNGVDFLGAGGLGAHNLVAGVREYLADVVDLKFAITPLAGPVAAPFSNVSQLAQIYVDRGENASWRNGERPTQSRWCYVAKNDNAEPTGLRPDSLFDLKPTTPNRIAFIPLTAEHCGSVDGRSFYADVPNQYGNDDSYARQLAGSASFGASLYSSSRVALGRPFPASAGGASFPALPIAFAQRMSILAGLAGTDGSDKIQYAGMIGMHGDGLGTMFLNHLSFGLVGGQISMNPDGDFIESTDSTNFEANGCEGFIGAGNGTIGVPYGIYCRHQHEYGDNGQGYAPNDLWGFGNDGLSTVGIASAKCTVKVRGYELALKTLMNAGITAQVPQGYQRWGSSGDGQMDFGTTAGYAKVYDAWPEEQTIFDPRYFAVMHFNPGTLLTVPGGSFVGDPAQDTAADVDPKGYTDMYRWVDIAEFDCDHRVPTISGVPGSTDLIEVPVGDFVLSDYPATPQQNPTVSSAGGGRSGSMGMIRPKSEWKVVTTRRGMLLPFKYRKKVIALAPQQHGHNIHTYDSTTRTNDILFPNIPAPPPLAGTIATHSPSVWIAASGMGYKVGDTFTMEGGNPDVAGSVVVSEVNEDEDAGPVGAIIEIRPGDHITTPSNGSFGENYDPQFFVNSEDYFKILDMNPNNPVSAAPQIQGVPSINPAGQANAGVGAVVYALHGQCAIIDKLDVGPLKQQPAVRFTPASDGRKGKKKLSPYARKLSIPKPNTDYAYDVFMQHHNDISHVFMNSDNTLDHTAQFTHVEIIGV
tara:strand:- start:1829 stop:6361 length:4533 start_codon:yes stop_codon:yes gene_type:complete